jgi:hypothetical protein
MELRQRRPRVRNERHLSLVRKLPCLICGRHPSEAAHVRYGDEEHGKRSTGVAEKPSDKWAVPLCEKHHRTGKDAQHSSGERGWWQRQGIDPLALCEALAGCGTLAEMESVFFKFRMGARNEYGGREA